MRKLWGRRLLDKISPMKKLVLIDGNAIMHRAYHAMPKLTTRKGEPIGAVQGFVNMLLKIINDLEPTHIAACFDRKEPTFRKKEFKKYQAHRPETDKELISQFAKIQDTLDTFKIAVFSKKGFEADDIIGTLAKKGEKQFNEVIIITGDKDILQLVTKVTKVYLPIKGLSVAKMMERRDVYGKMGVYPEQVIDLKALMGDSSDNYPGVYGIGPKTAEKLLSKYKTFKDVYKNLDKIDKNVRVKLEKGKKDGEVSYKLATIITDMNMEFDFEKMNEWSIGNDKTLNLFRDYGFRTLTRRIENVRKGEEKKSQGSLF